MIALWEEKRVDISPCLLTCFEIINSKIQKQFRSLPFLSSSFTHCCGHRVEECIAGAEGGMMGAGVHIIMQPDFQQSKHLCILSLMITKSNFIIFKITAYRKDGCECKLVCNIIRVVRVCQRIRKKRI
jgi:hypothetical protein